MSEALENGRSNAGDGKVAAKTTISPELSDSNSSEKAKKSDSGKRGVPPRRPFPYCTLEQSLAVPRVIKDMNGGNPWPPSEVAKALGLSAGREEFYHLAASSRDYGLTQGTKHTKTVELLSLGREVVYALSAENEQDGLKKAFLNVELFKKVYEYYQGGSLPELKYLENTLETRFGIPSQYHKEFFDVYTGNRKFLESYGITHAISSSELIKMPLGSTSVTIGEPILKTALVAFVAMPFSERTDSYEKGFFDEVLRNLITPAAIEAGFKVETARREGSDVIHSTIVNDLIDADLVIADLTEHNPNVLFELGVRMAMEKPIALIKAQGTPAIFDVDNTLRVVEYSPKLWKSTLELDVPKLTNHIKGSWENRNSSPSYMKILKRQIEG